MNLSFGQQAGIITGAASGLGLAIARSLDKQGARLALLDKDREGLESAASYLSNHHHLFPCDIRDENAVRQIILEWNEVVGGIHFLVNSAGITGATNIKTHETDTRDIQAVFDINFMGAYFTSKHVLPFMLKQGYGRILHIASIAGKEGNAGMMAYSASKAALIGMTKTQGKEYAESGITINALAPAVIRTALVEKMPAEQVRYMTDKIPMKRCGTLEELAEMATFILSSSCSFTTGFTFDLSGGRATY